MRKIRRIGRLNLQSQVEKENRCEQSISQRGSSGCVDCTEIMYSAVQNGKSGREGNAKEGWRGGRVGGRSPSLFLASPSAVRVPRPPTG